MPIEYNQQSVFIGVSNGVNRYVTEFENPRFAGWFPYESQVIRSFEISTAILDRYPDDLRWRPRAVKLFSELVTIGHLARAHYGEESLFDDLEELDEANEGKQRIFEFIRSFDWFVNSFSCGEDL